MTTASKEIKDQDYWEGGSVGVDSKTVGIVDEQRANAIDDAMELQMISIRLNKSLLADMKQLANFYETGYQPLIREVLSRFVKGEKRRIYSDYIERGLAEEAEAKESAEIDTSKDKRKSA